MDNAENFGFKFSLVRRRLKIRYLFWTTYVHKGTVYTMVLTLHCINWSGLTKISDNFDNAHFSDVSLFCSPCLAIK